MKYFLMSYLLFITWSLYLSRPQQPPKAEKPTIEIKTKKFKQERIEAKKVLYSI